MSVACVLVVEGPSDARRLRQLLARACPGLTTVGLSGDSGFTAIKDVPALARRRGLPPVHGRMDHGDERNLRQAVQLTRKLQQDGELPPETLLLWGRDTDGDAARRDAARAVRDATLEARRPLLVRAVAHRCGEAWCVAGATHPGAAAARGALRRALGFDPVAQPGRLGAKRSAAPPGAKEALEALTDGDHDLERDCLVRAWEEAPLKLAEDIGLADLRGDLAPWRSPAR